jgi:hypothetical protein
MKENTLSSYLHMLAESDLVLETYEENGKQFVKVLKDRWSELHTFEVLNSDLNDNTLFLKRILG